MYSVLCVQQGKVEVCTLQFGEASVNASRLTPLAAGPTALDSSLSIANPFELCVHHGKYVSWDSTDMIHCTSRAACRSRTHP